MLSRTELDVARLLAVGRSAEEIVRAVPECKAVDACRRRIYRKLGIGDRVELIRWAMKYDIGNR